MRNLKPTVFAKISLTFLLLTHTTTSLPLVPDPVVSSIWPSVRNLHLGQSPGRPLPISGLSTGNIYTTKRAATATPPAIYQREWFCCAERCCCIYGYCVKKSARVNHTSLIESSPAKVTKGMEKLLTVVNPWSTGFGQFFRDRHHDEENDKKRAAANSTATSTTTPSVATNDDDDDDGDKRKETISRRTLEEEEKYDDTVEPIIRIFSNGSFTSFTAEETTEFYILRTAQGEGPDLRDPPLEHPAPLGIDQTPKPSKEPSGYDQSRTCDSSGEWCPLPREGSTLLAGIGIGSCTYYREDELRGKTISYQAC